MAHHTKTEVSDFYGEDYAKFIKKKPVWKWLTKKLMDLVFNVLTLVKAPIKCRTA